MWARAKSGPSSAARCSPHPTCSSARRKRSRDGSSTAVSRRMRSSSTLVVEDGAQEVVEPDARQALGQQIGPCVARRADATAVDLDLGQRRRVEVDERAEEIEERGAIAAAHCGSGAGGTPGSARRPAKPSARSMPVANAILAELPAEIDGLPVEHGREVDQAELGILELDAQGLDAPIAASRSSTARRSPGRSASRRSTGTRAGSIASRLAIASRSLRSCKALRCSRSMSACEARARTRRPAPP